MLTYPVLLFNFERSPPLKLSSNFLNKTLPFFVISLLFFIANILIFEEYANGQSISQQNTNIYMRSGIKVSVYKGGDADRAGVKSSDIIIRYGEKDVLDYASYFAAVEFYSKSSSPSVQIVVLRKEGQASIIVPTGELELSLYDQVYHIYKGTIERELKIDTKPFTTVIKEVEEFLDKAVKEKQITYEQSLTLLLDMIPDKASDEENQKRNKILEQVFATHNIRWIRYLGNSFFRDSKRLTAIECLKYCLRSNPLDLYSRDNLYFNYRNLKMVNEIEALATNNIATQDKAKKSDKLNNSKFDQSLLSGIKVIDIYRDCGAREYGLKDWDIIFKYGDKKIIDQASYFMARKAYKSSSDKTIQLGINRKGQLLTLKIPKEELCINFKDENIQLEAFYDLMSDYNRNSSLECFGLPDPEAEPSRTTKNRAENILAYSEKHKLISDAQLLVAKIAMIPDNGNEADDERRYALLEQLFANYPISFILTAGQENLFERCRFKAAIECFKTYLKHNPKNESVWLNMGVAYNNLQMYDKAQETVDYVLDNKLPLSPYGYSVALRVKALSEMGKKNYRSTIAYVQKGLMLSPSLYQVNLWLLATAKIGDIKQFQILKGVYKKSWSEDYVKNEKYVDAVEVYLLVKDRRIEEARAIANRWKAEQNISRKLKMYWYDYPGGQEIVDIFNEVMESNRSIKDNCLAINGSLSSKTYKSQDNV
jgi:tetratricopeptide (TPR) repeat protein